MAAQEEVGVGAGRLGWRRGEAGGVLWGGGVGEGVGWRMASLWRGALSAERFVSLKDKVFLREYSCICFRAVFWLFAGLGRLILLELARDRGWAWACW